MEKEISQAVIRRMPRYYRYLGELLEEGVERISSNDLSHRMMVTASQIRQDLNNFGGFGQQGYGYNVKYLYDEIGKILGLNETHNIIMIGAGNLGQAITNYVKFERFGFIITALFDVKPSLKGQTVRDIPIYMMDELDDYCKKNKVDIAALTLPKEKAEDTEKKDETKEPEKTTIFYVTDAVQQSQYINMFREAGKNAVILSHNIDTTFISHLEQKDQTIQFKRIDADVTEELKGEDAADEETAKTLTELFRKSLGMDKLEVKVENLKNESVAAMMTLSEESRRMQDMMKMYNMYGMDPSMFGGQETLVLNVSHPLVKYLAENQKSAHAEMICQQLYDLAMLSHKQLSPDEMTKFVQRSNEILMLLTK